jgi:predicted GIY-YIG superfamily endonuclease
MINALIYKLVCNKTQKVYYGSTINTLQKRKDNHRQHYKLFLKGKFFLVFWKIYIVCYLDL